MFLRLKIEETRQGLRATLSQRGEDGKLTETPAVFVVADRQEAKQRAKAMARALGLKTYGFVDKTAASGSPQAAAPAAPQDAA